MRAVDECPKCGNKKIQEKNNFCRKCGHKLKEICNCWVKKGNYNCGESSCPGYGLNVLEMRKAKAQGNA